MKPIIVTAGETFTDIDAFACAIAYAELLDLEGKKAEAVLPGILNHSITPTIRSWNLPFLTKPSSPDHDSVIVDVSEPVHVAKCAPMESIIEAYDHRFGFEKIWNEKLGKDSHIEAVGACTTLIWEEFKKRGFADKISAKSANLLMMGTVSNTLNFGAQVTDQRDIAALKELEAHGDLPPHWKATYFSETEAVVLKDVPQAIKNDTKVLDVPGLGFPVVMGQLELWDSSSFAQAHMGEIEAALESFGIDDWFLSMPSIKEGKNRLYSKSQKVKDLLASIIGAKFSGDMGVTDKMWLRKEVRKKLFQMVG